MCKVLSYICAVFYASLDEYICIFLRQVNCSGVILVKTLPRRRQESNRRSNSSNIKNFSIYEQSEQYHQYIIFF